MQLITQTGSRGKVVLRNAATLDGALAQGATTLEFTEAVFTDGQTVTVGEEDITLGTTSDGGYTFTGCTRGANGTTDNDHADRANARLATGTELLSNSFDGSTYFSAIRCGGEIEAMYGIEINGELKYISVSTPYQLEVFFPTSRYQPANDTVVKVLVWSWAEEAVFWAEMQS